MGSVLGCAAGEFVCYALVDAGFESCRVLVSERAVSEGIERGDKLESDWFLFSPCRAVEFRSCSALAAMSRRSCLLSDILIVVVLCCGV